MSFPRGTDYYGGGGHYRRQLDVRMSGKRLPERFGRDFIYPSSEDNVPVDHSMTEDEVPPSSGYEDYGGEYAESDGWTDTAAGYESGIPDTEYGSGASVFSDPYEGGDSDHNAYEDYHVESGPQGEGTVDIFSPPIGYWNPAADYATQQYAIKRMIQNRDNAFDLFASIEYKLADGSRTKWSLANEWGADGKNTPYSYSGSKYTGDRIVSRIWLMHASHNAPVTQTLHFSMPNSHTSKEMMKPIIPLLLRTHEEGPTQIVLEPGQKLEKPYLLWFKDMNARHSPIVEHYPGVTADQLEAELEVNSNPREKDYVKNLTVGSSILLKYIQDKMDNEGYKVALVPVLSEGYYKIPIKDAQSFIELWKTDQSRDLTVKHLYNLTMTPNRGVRSPKDSALFHEDPFQDKAELMNKMSDWSLGEPAEEKSFASKVIREKPITVYWTIRVELVPFSRSSSS